MKKLLMLSLSCALLSPAAFAKTECTTAPESEWQDQTAFQEHLKEKGYEIKKFKVTAGNCYEIYGFDKDGRKVEIYHNPVTGEVVKEKIKE